MKLLDAETEKFLKARIEARYKQGKLTQRMILNIETQKLQTYTPDQIIAEVRKGSPMGEEFLLIEKKLADELKKRL
jgi:hypothetical protein